ncbi:MAG: NAD-dependent epimerase/dehydratase family protein [Solirubrobacterales bacterium]
MNSILVTGGAGFVGSNLAIALATRHPDWRVTAFDNLYRKGSELNLGRLADAGVEFLRGDVRSLEDLEKAGPVDALIECSAEPSVMSGIDGDTSYLVETNLTGAYNCLELARRRGSQFIFLSTSRVYPLRGLRDLTLEEASTRFELAGDQPQPGISSKGVSEAMPLAGPRTLYGSTKLAAELLTTEFGEMFGIPTVINRCGVIAGPWQMGKVDQGVFTHWMLAHLDRKPLSYIGYGGSGKQVRDLLHIEDLIDLVELQVLEPETWNGQTFNVGGGREVSLSLLESSGICARLTGNQLEITPVPEDRAGDVPVYLSDCSALFAHTSWRPQRDAETILRDIYEWIDSDRDLLEGVLR